MIRWLGLGACVQAAVEGFWKQRRVGATEQLVPRRARWPRDRLDGGRAAESAATVGAMG